MKYDKRILNQGGDSSEGIVMAPNHYRHDLAFLNELAAEAKGDFPDLIDNKIQAFSVTSSLYNQGFWGIVFPLPANTTKEGYRVVSNLDFWHN